MTWRDFSYRAATLAAAAFLALAVLGVLYGVVAYIDWKMHLEQGYAPPLISLFGVLIAAIGTFTAVFFGWRSDRRQAKELELKMTELEKKLEQATGKREATEEKSDDGFGE